MAALITLQSLVLPTRRHVRDGDGQLVEGSAKKAICIFLFNDALLLAERVRGGRLKFRYLIPFSSIAGIGRQGSAWPSRSSRCLSIISEYFPAEKKFAIARKDGTAVIVSVGSPELRESWVNDVNEAMQAAK